MNFDFTEEQQMVRDSIARFVQDDYDWDTRKAIVASEQGMSRDNCSCLLSSVGCPFPLPRSTVVLEAISSICPW